MCFSVAESRSIWAFLWFFHEGCAVFTSWHIGAFHFFEVGVMSVPVVNSTLYLFVDYLNAADIALFSDVLAVDCWISELVLTKDPVLKKTKHKL